MSSLSPATTLQTRLLVQLADRRARLERSINHLDQPADLLKLLNQVDRALSQTEAGLFGRCDVCHLEVGESDLAANPMAAYCLCELSPERQRALEHDLDLAWRVQAALLPIPDYAAAGWRTHFRYLPHGPVSGDYCDLISAGEDGDAGLYFMLGDVSGKGVAASLLMAHLNASFRALAQSASSSSELVGRANRLLAESTLTSHYATLVCGRASASGEVEIVNAGHCPPMVVRRGGTVEVLEAAGLPIGLGVAGRTDSAYAVERTTLAEGETLVLYTDGLSEATNSRDEEYGTGRLSAALSLSSREAPRDLIRSCLTDLGAFLGGSERSDDLTVLALQRQTG